MNDLDRDKIRELTSKIAKLREQGSLTDEAYWMGYLHAYCDQNAIGYDEIESA